MVKLSTISTKIHFLCCNQLWKSVFLELFLSFLKYFLLFIIFLMRGQGVWIWLGSLAMAYVCVQHMCAVCKIDRGKKNFFLARWVKGRNWVGRICFPYKNATFFGSAEIKKINHKTWAYAVNGTEAPYKLLGTSTSLKSIMQC